MKTIKLYFRIEKAARYFKDQKTYSISTDSDGKFTVHTKGHNKTYTFSTKEELELFFLEKAQEAESAERNAKAYTEFLKASTNYGSPEEA